MRLPTLPEIFTSGACIAFGHDWENGRCIHCGVKK